MDNIITNFASSAASSSEKKDILASLGIDWTLLGLQAVAFLILVWILGKFVYPVFMKIIDERQAKLDESVEAADKARQAAEESEAKVADEMKKARAEARDIVATAKSEAGQLVEKAEKDARTKADHIIEDARAEIDKSILAAQKSLEKDTLALVKKAAGYATANIADDKFDAALIEKSLKEAK